MKHEAIRNIYPNIKIIDDGAGCFDNDGNLVTVDENLIEQECLRLQAEYDSKQYQRDRVKEYPSFAEQFDLLYHGGIDAWKAAIDEVKLRYPKP